MDGFSPFLKPEDNTWMFFFPFHLFKSEDNTWMFFSFYLLKPEDIIWMFFHMLSSGLSK
jgi:hypothetical protein